MLFNCYNKGRLHTTPDRKVRGVAGHYYYCEHVPCWLARSISTGDVAVTKPTRQPSAHCVHESYCTYVIILTHSVV